MEDLLSFMLQSLNKVWNTIYNFKILDTLSIFDILLILGVVGILVKVIYNRK